MVVYCDMDGVLTDYDASFTELFGDHPNNVFAILTEEEINNVIDNTHSFWADMPWTKDGKELWNFIKDYSPILLTTPAETVKTCKADKIRWKNKHLSKDVTIIFSNSKQDYAASDAILIDDKKENIEKFISKGGLGILHTSAKETIQQLIRIMNDLLDDKIVAKTKYFTIKQTANGTEYNDVTRSSAVCLPIRVIKDNLEVLVRKEHNAVRGEFYTLVGGGIEPGETVEVGILRELREEAGLVATESQLYAAGQLVNDKYTKNKIPLFFVLFENTQKTVPSTDGTVSEALAVNFWISLEELPNFMISIDDSFLLAALFKFLITYIGV